MRGLNAGKVEGAGGVEGMWTGIGMQIWKESFKNKLIKKYALTYNSYNFLTI